MFLQFNPNNSYWPLFMSVILFFCFLSVINYFCFLSVINLLMSFIFMLILMLMWFMNLYYEAKFLGSINLLMQMTLKMGMIFFIMSEIMFFFSFFWSYFHFMFLHSGEFGGLWPPINIVKVNYLSVPLLNTMLLLSSGLSITVGHNLMLMNNLKTGFYLLVTFILGLIFSFFQVLEYSFIEFNWSMSCYSSIFFMGTGFHGCHVLMGSFMIMMLFMMKKNLNIFSSKFEMIAWYWHFVDMIWIILFTEFYWWV
uniref:Cytochrome c oxidase subunit 3 n=1 Tax=Romanomermis nielseni TaxID=416167 RepID=A1Z3A3_9BILA|nr:cytochrome c oxidase subunit III [Romanomermis nielseni]ABL73786.1 cytochrome c oxidase subunit III [Romanomermis nielseni]